MAAFWHVADFQRESRLGPLRGGLIANNKSYIEAAFAKDIYQEVALTAKAERLSNR